MSAEKAGNIINHVQFNCWKHHKKFISEQIIFYSSLGESIISGKEFESIKKNLLSIGNSQMDLYTGNLKPAEIINDIIVALSKKMVYDQNSYKTWLYNEGKDYRILTVSDKSKWTLTYGSDSSRYLHIHPAKYSIKTLRVRSRTLKTAIAAILFSGINNIKNLDLKAVNEARKTFLKESPVKSYSDDYGIGKIIILLKESI
jgi:hypothetical protein